MDQPQFIDPSGRQPSEHESKALEVWLVFLSPLVGAFVVFFWLALDNPPLPILALLICIASVVVTMAACASIARSRGVPPIAAILIGILAVPCAMIAASFFVIAAAFGIGGMLSDIF
jgi:hypothetical protein